MTTLGCLVHEKIQGGLHHGVKRVMAVIRSRFKYDMGLIANGFIMDPDRTDEENEAACLDLIKVTEEPGGRLAKLFEVEVVPPTDDEACKPSLVMKAHVIEWLVFVSCAVMA
jgi:hypothetical protein